MSPLKPFAELIKEAKQLLEKNMVLRWRVKVCLKYPQSGMYDNPDSFFGRPLCQVNAASVIRWRALCEAQRELDK